MLQRLDNFFHLKENNTTVSTEIIAGITTFLAMAYILTVNPTILGESGAGMPTGAVFLATIFATVVGCLLLGLFANVPLAQSASLGLNTIFTYTIVQLLGFTWQEALSMVFICGIINMIITISRVKIKLIMSIPKSLKIAMGCGIGIFIAYSGLINSKFISMVGSTPSINWTEIGINPAIWVFLIGLILTSILVIFKIKGAFILSIILTTLIGLIPIFGVTNLNSSISLTEAFEQLPSTLGVIFTPEGIPALFSSGENIPFVIITILIFSLIDICETVVSIIGVGREIHLLDETEIKKATSSNKLFSTRSEKALIADATATTTGAIIGTSNISTFVESFAGIEAGGKTGLTTVVTAICFAFCIFITPLVTIVPAAATAPIMIIVGIFMLKSLIEIEWNNIESAIPCFFTGIFTALCYSIPDGIACGFIIYSIIKIINRETKEVPHMLWGISSIFLLYIILRSLISSGVLTTG